MSKTDYKKHLCTFMGRKANLKILLRYIERALEMNAIDHYWMIDMTRNLDDHEYIFEEQQRLNGMYPGRVHVHNRNERKKLLLQPEEKVKETIGKWGTFYSFLTRFGDNDIIAKCDDDITFIDVETLSAAYELRWRDKNPYIMHANCINNGVTAYHQRMKGIWNEDETLLYPTCGLTGPLFSDPEIACKHHIKFCKDLSEDISNINKYKLQKNIYFCNRVSINFIFMLGSDRNTLSKIDEQDEYETSSKIPQRLDRPNMIIGDFTVAHHTYGVQEPVMEKLGTYNHYNNLANTILSQPDQFNTNKNITTTFNSTSTIKYNNIHLMRSWTSDNRVAIKNDKTGKYLTLEHDSRERTIGPKKISTGKYLTKSRVVGRDTPMMWYIQDETIRTGAEILKTTPHSPNAERFNSHLVNVFYQGNYKTNKFVNISATSGTFKLESAAAPGMFLVYKTWPNGEDAYMIEKIPRNEADDWSFEQLPSRDRVVLSTMSRETPNNIDNDHTYSINNVLPKNDMTRGFYWMVTEYIWEFIHKRDNVYHIKLVADDKPDLYLSKTGKDDVQTGVAEEGEVVDKQLKHVNSGLYLSVVNDKIKLSPTGTSFQFDID